MERRGNGSALVASSCSTPSKRRSQLEAVAFGIHYTMFDPTIAFDPMYAEVPTFG
jgi:hypothetical protein